MKHRAEIATRVAEREEILGRLRALLIERLRLRREARELDPDAPLFGAGLGLDSLDAVEIVVCLDSVFGIAVKDNLLVRQQMRSLNTLADFILAHPVDDATRA